MDRGPIEPTYVDEVEQISHSDVMTKLEKLLTRNKVLVTDLQTEPRFQNGKRNGRLNGSLKESHISI
jgi:hypothetical protein